MAEGSRFIWQLLYRTQIVLIFLICADFSVFLYTISVVSVLKNEYRIHYLPASRILARS